VGNIFLSWNLGESFNSSLIIASHQGSCGEEFSILANRIKGQQGICVAHSAEYLNWRYLDNPLHRYEIFTARHDGSLWGYAVFMHDGADAILVDLFGMQEPSIHDALVYHVIGLSSKRGVQTLSTVLAEAHPYRTLLERRGFRVRETSPLLIHYTCGKTAGEQGNDAKLLFMHGDRDS
jgi:hypothetical protein